MARRFMFHTEQGGITVLGTRITRMVEPRTGRETYVVFDRDGNVLAEMDLAHVIGYTQEEVGES